MVLTSFLNYWLRQSLFRKIETYPSIHCLFKSNILHKNLKRQTIIILIKKKTAKNIAVLKIKFSLQMIFSYGEIKSSKKCANSIWHYVSKFHNCLGTFPVILQGILKISLWVCWTFVLRRVEWLPLFTTDRLVVPQIV